MLPGWVVERSEAGGGSPSDLEKPRSEAFLAGGRTGPSASERGGAVDRGESRDPRTLTSGRLWIKRLSTGCSV